MNLPNLLTMLRIFSIPVLVVVLLSQFEGKELAAVIIFLLAALTDTLDGLVARKRGQVTILGQILDPIADKLLITSAFICLVELGAVSAWMVVIILGRELAVTGFRAIASSKGIYIASSKLGKFKMTSEAITICLLILGEEYLGRFNFISQIGLWVVLAIATISAAEYCIRFGPRVISKHS